MSGSTTTITVITQEPNDNPEPENTPKPKDTREPFSEPEAEITPKSDDTPGKSAQTDLQINRVHSTKARKCDKFQNAWQNCT